MAAADSGGGSGSAETWHVDERELSAFLEKIDVKEETEEDKVKLVEQSDQLVHEYGRLVSVSACRHGLPESRKLNS
jgi:ribulose kinase